jgi:hypothetical protein
LDQETPNLSYEEPSNAVWCDSAAEGDGIPSVLFYPELMIPKNLPYPVSPFIATSGEFSDISAYQGEEALRRHIKQIVWPSLQRSYVHFENGNTVLLEKEAASISKAPPKLAEYTLEERAGWVLSGTKHFFDYFVANPKSEKEIGELAARTVLANEPALRRFAEDYMRSGRMAALWKELKSVRRQFMSLYESFVPILGVRRYWNNPDQDMSKFELSIKNFEDLKGFYIDCLETTFRFLVIGLAFARIEQTGTPDIPTSGGNRDIWWFEAMNNGIKTNQLDKYPVFLSVTVALDTSLRNGVGHHSAHYDVTTDEISYVKADSALLNEVRMPFTLFVSKTYDIYCAFERATVFFHFLFLAGGGKLA